MNSIKEVNVQTGVEKEREMNASELKQYEIDKIKTEAIQAAIVAKAQAKAELLERLGINADEAKLLLA